MLQIEADGSKWLVDEKGRRPYRWYHALHEWALDRYHSRGWRKKQKAFADAGTRYYGDGGTIHGTTYLDVEVCNGRVVAVWFRCQTLPFKQTNTTLGRAKEMDRMYEGYRSELHGVEIKDKHD